jgi:hypothetical protein
MEPFTGFSLVDSVNEKCPAIGRLRKGYVAACEIPAVKFGRRAWIGVYPLHCHQHLKARGDYRIRVFEVEEEYLVNDNDVWEGVMESRGDFCVADEASLLARIEEFIDPFALSDPQSCEYPV